MSRAPVIAEPGREDSVVAASVGGIGGQVGRFARVGATWWTPLRVLVAMAGAGYLLGYVLDLSCRSQLWRIPERYEHLCYSDIPPLYSLRGFADGLWPYLQSTANGQYLEYPVLTGAFMQVAAWVTSAIKSVSGGASTTTTFFDVNVVLLFIPLVVTVVATALVVRRRPWDAAMVALAPTMIMAATVNWDLLPLAFAALCLLFWARRHPFAAGLMLGLAIASKFYPLVFLFAFLLLTIRTGRWRAFGALIGGTALSWAVVNVPIAIANAEGWSYFYRLSKSRGEDFGSVWFAMTEGGLPTIPGGALNYVATGSFALLCLGIAWVVLAVPQRPRLAAVLFLVVAAFILTNKVYSPQYVLWLVPLAALARPRWRDFLVWQMGELIYFAGIWWFLVSYGVEDTKGLTGQQYALVIVIHVLATVYFSVLVLQDMFVPAYDPVRNDGFEEDRDDPGGGVFDGAPDRFSRGRARRQTATL